MFGDPNMEIRKDNAAARNHLEQDISVIQQLIKQHLDIGLAECGKEILCLIVQEKIV